jgi:hypothetical protein
VIRQRLVKQLRVRAGGAFEICDPGAGIGCDHRDDGENGLLAILFQFLPRPAEADFASQLAKIVVGLRSRQQLQPCPYGLSDAAAAGLLGLLKKFLWDFDRDFPRRHN